MRWTEEDIRRMERIIGQAERKFGRRVPRSQADNAPYPFHESSMPGNWDWPLIWNLSKKRWEMMTVSCNRKWETIDTMETLFLECIVQYLDADHKEFLGLPLVPFIRHPLRFSVAHKHHGTQMRTGFNNPHPTSFNDYEPHLSNILFETWASNAMKSDFEESLYDEMLADLATVNISKKWYDPDLAKARGIGSEDDEELPPSDSIEWELEDGEMADEYEGEFDFDEEISGSEMEDEVVEEA